MSVWQDLMDELKESNTSLVAVSKTKPDEQIMDLYNNGQRIFGENRVADLCGKHERLPQDIEWHFIGHLQSKKVKSIVPFVQLIHAVDSLKLLKEIQKQAAKIDRRVNVLLQMHIAQEESKYGLNKKDLVEIMEYNQSSANLFSHINISGLMGMATFTEDKKQVREEFKGLQETFIYLKESFLLDNTFSILSMGMSGDYKIAIEEGSNMVRIGSMLFGPRNYS